MNQTTSTYLDLVRFSAALVVFLTHAGYELFTAGWLLPIGRYGHDAVVIFFVLSGFVIAYVVENKESTAAAFFVARLARLWSVVIPALALTVLLDYLGSRADYSLYAASLFRTDMPIWRLVANLFFVNEIWFISVRPFSNGPFWSIGYEFWYYIAFAALSFSRASHRGWAFMICAVLMDPKILVLMPVWWLGVYAYRKSTQHVLPPLAGWGLLVLPILIYAVYRGLRFNVLLDEATRSLLGSRFIDQYLGYSQAFANDYLVGCLVASHFVGVVSVSRGYFFAKALAYLERPIRFLAGYTFSVYLLHFPLLLFFAAMIGNDPTNAVHQFAVLAGTVLIILLVGTYTEKRKAGVKDLLSIMTSRLHFASRPDQI